MTSIFLTLAWLKLDDLGHVLRRLDDDFVEIASLITARLKQVHCFLRKNRKDIRHHFEARHFGENIKKKLTKAILRKVLLRTRTFD